MNWIVLRAVKLGLVFSAAIGVIAFALSGLRDILLDVYLLGMGGVLLLALVRTTSERDVPVRGSDFDRAVDEVTRRSPSDSGELALLHDVEQSVASGFHLHVRLRPILRQIAAHRLWMRFGVDLDREPDRAHELVGAEAWELVRPERPPPLDRLGPGPPASRLRLVVEELERL
jgi:hypothetical protein